jgi:hypothetical protein
MVICQCFSDVGRLMQRTGAGMSRPGKSVRIANGACVLIPAATVSKQCDLTMGYPVKDQFGRAFQAVFCRSWSRETSLVMMADTFINGKSPVA